MRLLVIAVLVILSSCVSKAQKFSEENIRKHIEVLAHDSLGGRGTGTLGETAARNYIEKHFKALGLEPAGDERKYSQAFTFHRGVHGQGESGTAYNIAGFLNNDAATTIIIGAHYDHLGTDGQESSLDANPATKIHNGADDNASGVAGVIELARFYTTNDIKENNNFLFLCFSGEEMGLLGSKYFADHAPIELSTVNFMINMDMIGRLNPQTKSLIVHGTGTSPVWEPLIKKLKPETLTIATDSSGIGPSDHTSFYLKDIPVLHFFTGSHADYHKPSDDIEKINLNGESEVLKFIARMINDLNDAGKLTFLKTKAKQQSSIASFKVTLGIMPSYASDVEGLKVDGVTDGKPGDRAGLKTGDIIIQMGDFPVKDIYGYMDALSKFKKEETVPVKVQRGKEVITLSVTF
ncbi:MAG TPA: M20/M25/M40 family metallo-hydrolase [Chryseosolibacter sp.]|nr:M20/M25/M40 family metallo-hydrolase [Chryseosolibacter sp.]